MKTKICSLLFLVTATLIATVAKAETALTIATVNNNDMIVMQRLSKEFQKKNPEIKLNWVVLEENTLRQKLTTDIATQGGQFDVMTIGMFETPIWGKKGWLSEFNDIPPDYDIDDVLKSVRNGLSTGGKLFALPFYAESQITFYRKDLFEKAGITMPDQPSWEQIGGFAAKIKNQNPGVYGVCLRGKPGWGENMGQINPVVNSYGGRWFDMKWRPQLDTQPWKQAVSTYVNLIKTYGPPGAASNGYNENLALFSTGKCGIWVDATVAAGTLSDRKLSQVADKMGYAKAPIGKYEKGNHYLWSWALTVPASSKHANAAKKFIYWATSKDYVKRVAMSEGWAAVPPGTRTSTYKTPEYLAAAPFATLTLNAIETADPTDPTQEKVPYIGISYVGIPEFQSFGTSVGQQIAAAIAGKTTVDQALSTSQRLVERSIRQAGY